MPTEGRVNIIYIITCQNPHGAWGIRLDKTRMKSPLSLELLEMMGFFLLASDAVEQPQWGFGNKSMFVMIPMYPNNYFQLPIFP